MPYLIQKSADGSPVNYWNLHSGPISVGRGEKVDARIDDKEMSRQHFRVSREDDAYVLEDLGSHNGTLVNGKRVEKATLQPDDKIRAGKSYFVFVEGLSTVIGKLEKEGRRYSTYVRKLSRKKS